MKAPKSTKAPKPIKPDPLVGIEPPIGSMSLVFGTAGIRYNTDGSMLVLVDLNGVWTTEAKVILTEGTDCNYDVANDGWSGFNPNPHICGGGSDVSADGDIDSIMFGRIN